MVLLYDVIEWVRRHGLLYLLLWLFGFDGPFERVRQLFLTFFNAQVQAFTRVEKDLDAALFQISTFIVTYLVPRWKYTPRPEEMLRRLITFHWHGIGLELRRGRRAWSEKERVMAYLAR